MACLDHEEGLLYVYDYMRGKLVSIYAPQEQDALILALGVDQSDGYLSMAIAVPHEGAGHAGEESEKAREDTTPNLPKRPATMSHESITGFHYPRRYHACVKAFPVSALEEHLQKLPLDCQDPTQLRCNTCHEQHHDDYDSLDSQSTQEPTIGRKDSDESRPTYTFPSTRFKRISSVAFSPATKTVCVLGQAEDNNGIHMHRFD
jgi:hypothetical protein